MKNDKSLLTKKHIRTPFHSSAALDRSARALAHLLARHVCVCAALGLLNALAFATPPAQAAVTEAWVQRYNGPSNLIDYATAVAVDGSGNVVVTGYSATIKYLADGTGVWTNNTGATALAVDGSGNVVLTGNFGTIKYLANGTGVWTNNVDNVGATAVAVDGSGNVVVTGCSGNGTNSDYYTAKYAAAGGALLWEQRYNGPANSYDFASAVAVDGSGNAVVTGVSDTRISGVSWVAGDYYTAKYAAADGTLLWEKRYNGPADSHDYANAVAVDGSGNVVVTGASKGFGGSHDYDYYTAKYAAADGALLWEKRYNGPANNWDIANAVAVDGSGNVAVTGFSQGGMSSYYGYDYYTAKYAAADGTLLWEQRYNGPATGDDIAQAVAADASGNVIVTGVSDGKFDEFGVLDADYYTAKYAAADGALLWEKRYNGPADGDDRVGTSRSLALGANGMVAVTGSSIGSSGTYDYATVVYRENLPSVSIALVPTGIRLRFTGVPGRSYTIERAPTVTGPWTPINTQTAPASSLLEYYDAPPPAGQAFYRTAQP